MNDRLNLGFERLKQINPNFTYKEWYFKKVKSTLDINNKSFYTDSLLSETTGMTTENFDPQLLVGTCNFSYTRMMWIEMLGSLRKFRRFFINENHLDRRDNIHVCKYGDEYIIGEGSNRFCLAKFLSYPMINIKVYEYEFNEKLYDNWLWFKDKNITPIDYDDTYWRFDYAHNRRIIIKNTMIEDFKKAYEDYQPNHSKSLLKALFSPDKPSISDRVEVFRSGDLNSKDLEFILHHQKSKY